MRGGMPLRLQPLELDLAVARAAVRLATPARERALCVVTMLADEKTILASCALVWVASRVARCPPRTRRDADHLAISATVAAMLPHLVKRLVDRERPDRRVVHLVRHGIPRSGNKWDSFPSGHAVHLGMLATALSRMVPPRVRRLLWPGALALAATRILLQAHYPSDIAAGLALGIGVDRVVATLRKR
jgi:membrane-associated phospholipid phosphatase